MKRKIILSNVKTKKLKQNRSDVLNMFQTVMFYFDKREKSDTAVIYTPSRAELEERLMSEIQQKCAVK